MHGLPSIFAHGGLAAGACAARCGRDHRAGAGAREGRGSEACGAGSGGGRAADGGRAAEGAGGEVHSRLGCMEEVRLGKRAGDALWKYLEPPKYTVEMSLYINIRVVLP